MVTLKEYKEQIKERIESERKKLLDNDEPALLCLAAVLSEDARRKALAAVLSEDARRKALAAVLPEDARRKAVRNLMREKNILITELENIVGQAPETGIEDKNILRQAHRIEDKVDQYIRTIRLLTNT
jgi:hypothetical protein